MKYQWPMPDFRQTESRECPIKFDITRSHLTSSDVDVGLSSWLTWKFPDGFHIVTVGIPYHAKDNRAIKFQECSHLAKCPHGH